MKITHLNNSFIVIEGDGTKLVCDPWTGISNYGTWHSIPIFSNDDIAKFVGDADYVYISHLHADHLDPETLGYCNLLNARFVINKNNKPTLRRRLEMLGATEVIECDPFTPTNLGGLKIATVPQMSQNTSGIDCEVDYDLDSSILVTDGQSVFFNQVDNPLSVDDMRYIGDWTRDNFGEIDLAALTCGAASEYPQCFINIDRDAEKVRVEKASIDMLLKRLQVIKPRHMCLGGGSYFIPGRNASLNQFIAVPPASEVEEIIRAEFPNLGFYQLEGGGALELSGENTNPVSSQNLAPMFHELSDALEATKDLEYTQDGIISDDIDTEIDRVLPLATGVLQKRLSTDGVHMKAQLCFALHSQLVLDSSGKLVSTPERTINLNIAPEHPDHFLILHIDKAMFEQLLKGKMIWNLVISGSQIMYERTPNVFHPTDTSALNFFAYRERK